MQKMLKNLEYDKILKGVAAFCKLAGSKEMVLKTLPCASFQEAIDALDFTVEADKILYVFYKSPLKRFEDTKDSLAKSKLGSVLDIVDIINVGRLLSSAREFAKEIVSISGDIPKFKEFAAATYFNEILERQIEETFPGAEEISDDATPKLREIRKNLRKINSEIRSILNSYVSGKEVSKFLQDKIVTMRGDRFVIPVKAECKGSVKGLIHDYSQSGSTIFIEPVEVVEKNNEIRSLQIDEKFEIEKILKDFTMRISTVADHLIKTEDILNHCDVAFAKATFAKETKSVNPNLNESGIVNINMGRHPLIDKKKVVPVSLSVGKVSDFLLISGPNTGGKTVSLKMTGLFALMAKSGMFIPAKEDSTVSFFDKVFCDIGDDQSIENELSTFSSHIQNLVSILTNVGEKSLVLIDELGGGTDPDEGAALALAILEFFLSRNAKGIVTTHYGKLKEYCFENPKVQNASMEFDTETLLPTYRLIMGHPGLSKALDIAKNLGVFSSIIDNAHSKISQEKKDFDKILDRARENMSSSEKIKKENQILKTQLEEEKERLEKLKEKIQKERENITTIAKVEAKRILNDAHEESEIILSEIKNLRNQQEITQKDVIEAAKLKNKISKLDIFEEQMDFEEEENLEEFDILKAKIGDPVYVLSMESTGIIENIKVGKNEIDVTIGLAKLTTTPQMLKTPRKIKKPKEKKQTKTKSFLPKTQGKFESLVEIKIIGKRVHEAMPILESFLDEAILRKSPKVRIIHGIGTGKLKEAVWEKLKSTKGIESIALAEYFEGGAGVTVVTFK